MAPPCRKIKAVVFDLDGTLVGLKAALASVHQTLRELNLPAVERPRLKRLLFRKPRDAFLDLFPDYSHLAGRAEQLFVRHYKEHAHQASLPHAFYTLKFLKRAGVKIGILSSKEKELVEESIASCRLCCDLFLSGEDMRLPKPHPVSLTDLLQRLHAQPGEALYVGDTPEDIVQGRRAGVITVGVTTGLHSAEELAVAKPDYIVSNVSEVLDIVRKAGA